MKSPLFLELVSDELRRVERRMLEVAEMDHPQLAQVLSQPLRRQGKRLRPAVALLAAQVGGDPDPDKVVSLAAAVEMVHTATLVHDDLIDTSPLRRGSPTVSHLWGNRVALFAGDYLFAKATSLAAETDNVRVTSLFAWTLGAICRGEMRQTLGGQRRQRSREEYFGCIHDKTASLFAAAAEGGAILGEVSQEIIKALRIYGRNLGMGFQIVDDILDFVGDERELGKPTGSDLRQGTITLPTIYFLEGHPQTLSCNGFWREGATRRISSRPSSKSVAP